MPGADEGGSSGSLWYPVPQARTLGDEQRRQVRPARRQVEEVDGMKRYKVVVEKHQDGYVAYPLGLKGVVVGQGDTYEEALADVTSAIRFHIESFGQEVFEEDSPVLEAFVAEAGLSP